MQNQYYSIFSLTLTAFIVNGSHSLVQSAAAIASTRTKAASPRIPFSLEFALKRVPDIGKSTITCHTRTNPITANITASRQPHPAAPANRPPPPPSPQQTTRHQQRSRTGIRNCVLDVVKKSVSSRHFIGTIVITMSANLVD